MFEKVSSLADALRQDFRYAFRSLRRRPLVTMVAAVSLALGIGVNTAIFSVLDRLLLSRLPVPAPDELVTVTSPGPRFGNTSTGDAGGTEAVFSHPLFRDIERMQTPFTAVGGFRDIAANLSFHGDTLSGEGLVVSGGYFGALGLRPSLGRLLTPDDDREGGTHEVVVLSHRYWMLRFGGNPSVLNDILTVNGVPMTIVGVAARGFDGTSKAEAARFFVPLRAASRITRWRDPADRRSAWIYALGRLAPGVSMTQAEARLRPPFESMIREVELPIQRPGLSETARQAFAARTVVLQAGGRGHNGNREETQVILTLLFTVAGFVLLIACANVANLLLARAAERTAEVGIRLAVGASRLRLVRLMLVESSLLALAGGAGALLVAGATMAGIQTMLPTSDAEVLAFAINPAVLTFTLALSLVTALVFGLAPVVHTLKATPASTPMAGRTTAPRGATRVRALLAGGQVALATALLAVAGLFVASLNNLAQVDLGVDRTGLSMFRLAPILNGYTPPRVLAFYDDVDQALRALPGVVAVSQGSVRILDDSSSANNMVIDGYTPGPDADVNARFTLIGTRYFSTMGIPLIRGREFTAADALDAPPIAVVNEAFVRKFGLGNDAIGRRIGTTAGQPPDITIVGVVRDAAYRRAREVSPPQYFRPFRQQASGVMTFYVRSAPGVDPAAIMAAVPGVVRKLDPTLPVDDLRTIDEQFNENTTSERVVTTLSSSLAALAALLAGIGLYAVLAYSVSQRLKEIGIRMALGAQARDVQRMVLSQGGRITLGGGLIGVALAMALAQVGRTMLFGVSAFDPWVLTGATALIVTVATGAGLVPARRAAAVNPVEALRAD